MNKSQLAELYARKDLPVDEFVKLPVFIDLEKDGVSIEKIEGFCLPEITKLICCSEILSELPWAKKYADVARIYREPSIVDALYLNQRYENVNDFKERILKFADPYILVCIQSSFDRSKAEKKSLQSRRTAVKKKLAQMQATFIISTESSAEADRYTQDLEEINRRIADIDELIIPLKNHQKLIKGAIEQDTEEVTNDIRSRAYEVLFPSTVPEEVFLEDFAKNGILTEETKQMLHLEQFRDSILLHLGQDNYRNLALPIIMRLYELGVVDIEAPSIIEFITNNADMTGEYLRERVDDLFVNKSSDDHTLLDIILRIECVFSREASMALFYTLWNAIDKCELWLMIFERVYTLDLLLDINSAIAAFFRGLDSNAGVAIVEALFAPKSQEMLINPVKVIEIASSLWSILPTSAIVTLIRKTEQLSRSAQRRIRAADRKINGQAQTLFSSIYAPIENLEILTTNLRLTRGEVSSQLIAKELVDIVVALRSGLLQMNLFPVGDANEWKTGAPVSFEPEIHCTPMNMEPPPEKVILQTMGFRYMEDNGEWQQYNAQVIPKTNRTAAKTSSVKRNHTPKRKKTTANPSPKKRQTKTNKGHSTTPTKRT